MQCQAQKACYACAGALPPIGRESGTEMADPIAIEFSLCFEEQCTLFLWQNADLLVCGLEINSGCCELFKIVQCVEC